jgi:serine/threonine-protein kinase HipA
VSACLACLRPAPDTGAYHRRCLQTLFGRPALPRLEVDMQHLHTVGLELAGRVAISGVQRKLALRLSEDRTSLEVAPTGSRFILKPPPQTFPAVPENELVTMRLAELAGIEIPPCALVPLADGALAFLVRRFDRSDAGRKFRMEDFCQLSEKPSKDRYAGSAEQCARVVARFASEPLIEQVQLFRRFLFSWWVANGDLHLKNLSLLTGEDGRHRLSPAYDLLNTEVILGDDTLALTLGAKRRNLTPRVWREFGAYCRLPEKVVRRELAGIAKWLPDALELLQRAPLEAELRARYAQGLTERAGLLS